MRSTRLHPMLALSLGLLLLATRPALPQQASGSEPFVQAYVDSSIPGPAHEAFTALAGSWVVEGRYRFYADGDWRTFTARATISSIFGGRFVVERFGSRSGKGQLEGIRILGYDNPQATYLLLGFTNQGTGFECLQGTAGEDLRRLEVSGVAADPASGQPVGIAMHYDLSQDDSFELRQYVYTPSSSQDPVTSDLVPVVEARYRRVRSAIPADLWAPGGPAAVIVPWASDARVPAHDQLRLFEGDWQVDGQLRFEPDGTWEQFRSTSRVTTLFDGRFVVERIRGEQTQSWPVPYEGLRLMGFNTVVGKFQYAALNNLSTGIQFAQGAGSGEDQSIVLDGLVFDPLSGKPTHWRTTYELGAEGGPLLREYPADPSGKTYLGIKARYRTLLEWTEPIGADAG